MASKVKELEERVAHLEHEVRELKSQLRPEDKIPWYRQIVGAFKNDPVYDEITRW